MGLIFEQWLMEQALSPSKFAIYKIIYQFIYLLPLFCILVFLLVAGQRERIKSYQPMLKTTAYYILGITAPILIIYPSLLANLWLSIAVLILSFIIGKRKSKWPKS